MRKLAILTFMSLDGVMQAPSRPEEDTSGDFQHGGWARPWWDEVMEQVRDVAMAEPYDMLLGRKTYELFAPHWQQTEDGSQEAGILNEATKYVVTNTLTELNWKNSVALTGDVVSELRKLKAGDGPLLQVHGSWQLIQLLLANGLIDEFRVWTFPLVLGSGKRLCAEAATIAKLTLAATDVTPNGVVMGIYRPEN
jgi:dihydrofolate reductase